MLSVLQRTVENEGRTAIRAGERLVGTRGEQEKRKVKSQKPSLRREGNPKTQVHMRTWGTLRVVLICDCAKAPRSIEGSLKDSGFVIRTARLRQES